MKINKTYSTMWQFPAKSTQSYQKSCGIILISNKDFLTCQRKPEKNIFQKKSENHRCYWNYRYYKKIDIYKMKWNFILTLFTLVAMIFHYQKATNIFGGNSDIRLMKMRKKVTKCNTCWERAVFPLLCAVLHKSRLWRFQVEYSHMDTYSSKQK